MGFWDDASDQDRTDHVNQALREQISEGVSLTGAASLKRMFMEEDSIRFIRNPAIDANPASLLGTVYYLKGTNQKLHRHNRGVAVTEDASAAQTEPVVMHEIVIDSGGAGELEALGVLSLKVAAKEVLELRTVKTRSSRADQRPGGWDNALEAWEAKPANASLLRDPEIASIVVVGGVSQYFISSKSFTKYEGSGKGGGWGVNVGGELYTSSSFFTLDVVYAVEAIELKSSPGPGRVHPQLPVGETLDLYAKRLKGKPKLFAPAPSR